MKIITEYNKDMIKQYIEDTNIIGVSEKQLEEIIFLKEMHVREALINMGWTPPAEDYKQGDVDV
jgi:hypothetical protein